MSKTAILFPGQGSQHIGMGRDFYERYPAARATFDQAAAVLGGELIDIIFNGPEDKLQLTEYTQPAVLTVSMAIFRVLSEHGIEAAVMAGLSLGEYSALVAAGAISFEDTLPVVQKRGIFMQEAVPLGQGKMVAVMGLSHDEVERVCRDSLVKGLVAPANYNCPGQIVISGHTAAVEHAAKLASDAGARKISELKVSVPFHCQLLEPVEARLSAELDKLDIRNPVVPVIFNYCAATANSPEQLKNYLVNQVSNPILWEQSIRRMISDGAEQFFGLGPGNSLSRLMKRIAPELDARSVEALDDIDKIKG